MAASELSPVERSIFRKVGDAVISNPFSPKREEIDDAILGSRIPEMAARVDALIALVRQQLSTLETQQRADLRNYSDEDRELLSYVFLFDCYHRHSEEFDKLIAAQETAGEESCPVHFADQTLGDLARRGFSAQERRKIFALFFQLRRSFVFIDQALVGSSPCMRALRQALWNNIFTCDIRWYDRFLFDRMEDFSTLLLGETGTGKGSAAHAIGKSGFIPFDPKRGKFVESFTSAFVPLNVSQFPESLIESELFGHKKGSFTGAVQDHRGAFASCSAHGSVFLDELGELDAPLQVKLLQVLQERTFRAVGDLKPQRFRGRVIAATNRSLQELRGKNGFRDDFYYRLCSDIISMPTLRQRLDEAPEELEGLVAFTLRRLLGDEAPPLLDMICAIIRRELGPGYSWPGNVRELEQCVRRILLKGSYEGDRSTGFSDSTQASFIDQVTKGEVNGQELLGGYCSLLYSRHGSYEAVARRTRLDRRTVKKYIQQS
ncbi:MAG: sigma-54-dependent transcriptional regulator [Planctomycetota bacterium]|jgi:hypothetical protein